MDKTKEEKIQKVRILNEQLQKELDKLWESGIISQEKLDILSKEHLRAHTNNANIFNKKTST